MAVNVGTPNELLIENSIDFVGVFFIERINLYLSKFLAHVSLKIIIKLLSSSVLEIISCDKTQNILVNVFDEADYVVFILLLQIKVIDIIKEEFHSHFFPKQLLNMAILSVLYITTLIALCLHI